MQGWNVRRPMALAVATTLWLGLGVGATAVDLKTEDDKILYAVGMSMAKDLTDRGIGAKDLDKLVQGLEDAVNERETQVTLEEYGPKIRELLDRRKAIVAQAEAEAGEALLKAAAKEKGARRTDSGLVINISEEGSGETPTATDTVRVHYHGTRRDGTVFDSSRDRGQPATFPLNRVIPCWTEAMQLLKVGAKAKITCPSEIAYGERGSPPRIKPGATLVFDVELLEIVK